MKKLRWVTEGEFWEVDVSTPVTVEGFARPAAAALPLGGLSRSRGANLSRPKQIDFFQRFMFIPFVPSFSPPHSLAFQRLLSIPLPADNWFLTLLGQFNVHKFVTFLRRDRSTQDSDLNSNSNTNTTSLQSIWRQLSDKKLYALNFCSELLLTPQDTILLSLEAHGTDDKTRRKKVVLHHKFPHHNLTLEAASPALFVDDRGNYWDVPFTMAMAFASLPSDDSGLSSHFCINHTAGSPIQRQDEGQPSTNNVPRSLLPGLCAKYAVSVKKLFSIWTSEAQKTKMVQPYDIFLSNPHISASALLGGVITTSLGKNSLRAQGEDESFGFRATRANSAISADLFASVSLSAQHGNFQKLFLDLTRFYARMDVPYGSKFLAGASRMALDLYNSQVPSVEAIQAICPSASLSFQQQIAGPFSFRVDAGLTLDMKKDWYFDVNDPVFAVEYALQVLGSAKAVAWYSPKQREFMIELRFFET